MHTFLYDISDYWRKGKKSLILKTSWRGSIKHLYWRGSVTWWCHENPHLVLHPDSQITCCMDSSSNDFSLPEVQQYFFWCIVFDKSILIVVISCWEILFSLPLSQSSPLFSTYTCCLSNCSKGQAEFPQLKNIFISSQNKLYLQLNHKRKHL